MPGYIYKDYRRGGGHLLLRHGVGRGRENENEPLGKWGKNPLVMFNRKLWLCFNGIL